MSLSGYVVICSIGTILLMGSYNYGIHTGQKIAQSDYILKIEKANTELEQVKSELTEKTKDLEIQYRDKIQVIDRKIPVIQTKIVKDVITVPMETTCGSRELVDLYNSISGE